MLKDPVRSFGCQFVYRGTLGAICRIQSNRGPTLSPPDREPAIEKVAKYEMRDPYKLYKNLMSIPCKSSYLVCITHFSENFYLRKLADSRLQVSITFRSPARPTASPFDIVRNEYKLAQVQLCYYINTRPLKLK
jgi:hypothetical protein